MAAQLQGTTYPMRWIPHSSLQGGRQARAEILQTQAGRARHLYEMLSGQAVDGNAPCAPIPPHSAGIPGHDHSGGVFGTPIVCTVYSATYGMDDGVLGAHAFHGRAPRAALWSSVTSGTKTYIYNGSLKCMWVPDCDPINGAYVDANLSFILRADAAATVYCSLGIANYTIADQTLTISGSGFSYHTISDRVFLQHGRLSEAYLLLWMVGTGSAGPTVSLLSVALSQDRTSPIL